MPVQNKLQVPVEISLYVQQHGIVKPFVLYLYLKFVSSGKLHESSSEFRVLYKALGIKSVKTIRKYIDILTNLNWIGYNSVSGYYFIRSFDVIRFIHSFRNRQATTLHFRDLKKMQAFVAGSILAARTNGKKYYWEVAEKRTTRDAVNKRGAAYHSLPISDQPRPDYYGVCLAEAKELLKCGKTRASHLKNLAAKSGFIKVKHHFSELTTLQEGNNKLRSYLADIDPSLACKLRFKKVTVRGVKMVKVLEQTQDEIIPTLSFKTVVKFCNMRVSPLLFSSSVKATIQDSKIA